MLDAVSRASKVAECGCREKCRPGLLLASAEMTSETRQGAHRGSLLAIKKVQRK